MTECFGAAMQVDLLSVNIHAVFMLPYDFEGKKNFMGNVSWDTGDASLAFNVIKGHNARTIKMTLPYTYIHDLSSKGNKHCEQD